MRPSVASPASKFASAEQKWSKDDFLEFGDAVEGPSGLTLALFGPESCRKVAGFRQRCCKLARKAGKSVRPLASNSRPTKLDQSKDGYHPRLTCLPHIPVCFPLLHKHV